MFINTNFCHNFNPNKQLKEEKNNQNTGQILIFNRIPKCGSTMMISLLIRLAVRNNFNLFKSPVDSEELVDEAEFTNLLLGMGVNFDKLGEEDSQLRDLVYVKHQFYVPIPSSLRQNITYINIMRDPVKRFVSGYYYFRTANNISKTRLDSINALPINPFALPYIYKIVDKKWLDENIHFCDKQKIYYIFKDENVYKQFNELADEWENKTLASCVMNTSDEECHDFSEKRPLMMTYTDVLVNQHANKDKLDKTQPSDTYPSFRFQSALPYFCGMSKFCRNLEDGSALTKAIHNIDANFEVVGVTEKMEETLQVLEHKLPRFFGGALEEYKAMQGDPEAITNIRNYPSPSKEEVMILKNNLKGEYRIYDYVRKKLDQQYKELIKK